MPDPQHIAATLRRERPNLEALAPQLEAAAEALALLDRDLLPRCGGDAGHLVCGIVGPNNAGKSALFNSLAGANLSPSEPTGGATRRLLGAAHPSLLAGVAASSEAIPFRLRRVRSDNGAVQAAREPADDTSELLVVEAVAMPEHLLLIDTPDFDSILAGHRATSESMLAYADLVVAVVTRHSYQNRAVVEFFREWLQHGRPWILVYNEALDADTAAAHITKLVRDVGAPPMATYWAPHDLGVARGACALRLRPLEIEVSTHPRLASLDLRELLLDPKRAAELKTLAFASSLARLHDQLDRLAMELRRRAAVLAELTTLAGQRGNALGSSVAARAMPAGPFLEAFRTVLDRRSNPVSRALRGLLRGVRTSMERLPELMRGRSRTSDTPPLETVEADILRGAWPQFWEDLARDLGPEARLEVRRLAPAAMQAALDTDLTLSAAAPALERAIERLATTVADWGSFRSACEQLIDDAIEKRGFDADIQAVADLATLAPLALASVFIVTAGGVGADVAILGGGALGAMLMEKYAPLLGSSIVRDARARWSELRGRQIAEAVGEAALPRTLELVRGSLAAGEAALASIERLQRGTR